MYSLSFTGFLNNTELKIFGRHQESNPGPNMPPNIFNSVLFKKPVKEREYI